METIEIQLIATDLHHYSKLIAALDEEPGLPYVETTSEWDQALPVISVYPEGQSFENRLIELAKEGFYIKKRHLNPALWQEAWQKDFSFLQTQHFYCSSEPSSYADRITLWLEPGSAFGQGDHATTQAILLLLERYLFLDRYESLLDVGTGTGILALAAKKAGLSLVCATDHDEDALEQARAHAKKNACDIEFFSGSFPAHEQTFELIVCNILPPILMELIPSMKSRLKPSGLLFLTGVHMGNQDQLTQALAAQGFQVLDQKEVRGWIALAFQKENS